MFLEAAQEKDDMNGKTFAKMERAELAEATVIF